MMTFMGTIASQENPDSGPPSEEGARAAILGAARKLAAREGVIEMTLTGVAKEAGVAATAIYTFFTSKNDLLQAVVADDLANLAKTMRRVLAPPGAAVSPPGEASEPPATQDAHETGTPAQVQELPRRFPVVQARREPA